MSARGPSEAPEGSPAKPGRRVSASGGGAPRAVINVDTSIRRALRFIVPYWRRLALVLALSALSTALSLYLPLLSRDFFDRALIGRDLGTLVRVVSLFAAVSVAPRKMCA